MTAQPERAPAPGGPEPDAEQVATAVVGCPTVAGLGADLPGEVATYLPGRRVAGVRVAPGHVEVHVVGRYGPSVAEIAAEVRRAVAAAVGTVQVDVHVDDLDVSAVSLVQPAAAAGRSGP